MDLKPFTLPPSFIPVDDPRVRCPLCGAEVKWACGSRMSVRPGGHADCQDGGKVSRRFPGKLRAPCPWAGAPVFRLLHSEVYVLWPLPLDRMDGR